MSGAVMAVGRAAGKRGPVLMVRLRLDTRERLAGSVGPEAADSPPISFNGWLEFMLAIADLTQRAVARPAARSDTPTPTQPPR